MFQQWVQEGTAATALPTHPKSVAESLLTIGNVIMWRQDIYRARVQVKPLVGVAQVLNPSHLLPSTLGEECVLQTPESSPIGES